ncbi:MAG: NUDIX domain-containing protein [Minisyncoccia bacterium]
MEQRPTFPVGGCGFLVSDGELLLGLRKNTAGAGQWGLPSGHLEKNETLEQCVLRELTEETGLVGTSATFTCVTTNRDPLRDTHYINFGFTISGYSGVLENKEPEYCSEWQWFPLTALPENLFFGQKPLIKLFCTGQLFYDGVEESN